MARTPLDQRLTELENHPKSAFLQEINRVVYAYLDGPPKRTLAAIAKTIGYSPAALTKWLTGENPIGPNECHKLCQTIGLDEQQIAGLLDLGDYEQRVVIRPTVFLSEAGLRLQHEVEQAAQHQWQEEERRVRLQTFISPYNHRFFDERRADFVGRTAELGEVRQRIEALRATGGYLAIAGPAGEGKSSLVAELIQQYGEPTTAYHFIPFSPGADEQINLLQSLLAKLLLKHNLLDHADGYIPMNAQIPTLCNSLQYLFDQLHQLGVQEVIFIDGLDQIKPDLRIGERDLSFLPLQLPPGIVIVIGTRPDDTLKPLELRAPLSSYPLPPLSPNDFAELLIHRQADLSPDQRTALYTALHGNAFDLDFAAKLIAMTPETKLNALLNTVKRNPRHLFGLALDRLKRDSTWHQAIKPVLGCLLATTLSEPMTEDGICAATGLEADQVSEALLKLGGLLKMVDHNGRAIYYLYHLKLIDYLQDAVLPPGQKIFHRDEICSSHARLAAWCESSPSGLAAIWQDATGNSAEQERRAYARQHYILHLAAAQQWDKLWAVLDEGSYGKAKLQHDPSTRSYALDLDMGRQAAAREEWEFEEGLARLPNLWRYSLLRCSLASQADKYPDEVFRAMARLSRAQEAIGMAELISDPHRKASVLMQIGVQLGQQAGRDREGGQVLLRAGEVAHTIAQAGERAAVLGAVAVALAQAGLVAEASRMAHAIADTWPRTQAFGDVATALAQRGEHTMAAALLTKATDLAHTMADRGQHAPALRAVAMGWSRMGQAAEAREVAGAIGDDRERAAALRDVAGALAQTGQKCAAIDLARTIGDDGQRARALAAVAVALMQAGQATTALPLLDEATAAVRAIEMPWVHAGALAALAVALARAGLAAAGGGRDAGAGGTGGAGRRGGPRDCNALGARGSAGGGSRGAGTCGAGDRRPAVPGRGDQHR